MGAVRQDDELTQRGANPRTGLVTPFIMTDARKASTGNDYLNTKSQHPKRKHRSNGRWKQDNAGWSLTDSPLPSPVVQGEGQSRAASIRSVQDRFVVDMPGVDNPYPRQMTNEQIEHYQRSLKSVCGTEMGNDAVVEPSHSSNHGSPSKISRKEMGSGSGSPREGPHTEGRLRINDKKESLRSQLLNEGTNNPFLDGLANAAAPDQPTRLSQYLPKIDLLHPSHFASPTSSYRRPSDLPLTRHQQANLKPDIPAALDSSPSRPKVHRQDGAIKVPKLRVGLRNGASGNRVSQVRTPSAATQDAANKDIGLENVRGKLTQTCNCSRCMGFRNQGSDTAAVTQAKPVPSRRSPTGAKKGQLVDVMPVSDEKVNARPRDKIHPLGKSPRSQSHPNQSDPKSSNGLSKSPSGQPSTLHHSGTFVKRVEQITTFLDTFPIPYLASTQHRLAEILGQFIIAFRHALPAVKVLKRSDARAEEYLGAVKSLLVAGVYLLTLVKIVVTVVKVTRLMMDIVAVVSWPARAVAVVLRWCLLG